MVGCVIILFYYLHLLVFSSVQEQTSQNHSEFATLKQQLQKSSQENTELSLQLKQV